ncbi:hypothetical protein PT2222_10392 [Paraburkholderia tropica]
MPHNGHGLGSTKWASRDQRARTLWQTRGRARDGFEPWVRQAARREAGDSRDVEGDVEAGGGGIEGRPVAGS